MISHDSVMEFGFEPVCDQVRAGSSYLVTDRFAAGLSQISLRYPGRRLAGRSEAGRRPVADLLARAS